MVEDSYLHCLQELRPMQPYFMIRGKPEGCKLIKDRNLRGDPANKVRDRRLRAVLAEKGWKPLVISAQGLKDATDSLYGNLLCEVRFYFQFISSFSAG
jgi:hypothetical protein